MYEGTDVFVVRFTSSSWGMPYCDSASPITRAGLSPRFALRRDVAAARLRPSEAGKACAAVDALSRPCQIVNFPARYLLLPRPVSTRGKPHLQEVCTAPARSLTWPGELHTRNGRWQIPHPSKTERGARPQFSRDTYRMSKAAEHAGQVGAIVQRGAPQVRMQRR
jgi:hypothetical protein